jgi:tRNA splicing ligase
MSENKSEVARVLEQIELEYQAAHRGLYGLAFGTAKHQFITARMEQMGKLHEKLQTMVGEEQAVKLLVETLEKA